MIIGDILLILQYQVSTTVVDLIVVFCIVSCLYLCLCCCVSVSLPNFRRIKIYINIHFQIKSRKQFYQTALGKCYGAKLPKCSLHFKNK